MILLIKKRGDYYRRFKLDIWGMCFLDERNSVKLYKYSWTLLFFLKIFKKKLEWRWRKRGRYIYRIDIVKFKQKRKKWKKRWLSLRLTRLYFLTLQDHQFRSYFKKATKLTGNLGTNYCHMLECRAMTILYRMNFVVNLWQCMTFVKEGSLYVNGKPVNRVNAFIEVSSLLRPKPRWIPWIRYHLFLRLTQRSILFNTPRFLFISYKFYWALLMKKPKKKDLVYPISIDIQRITGYY